MDGMGYAKVPHARSRLSRHCRLDRAALLFLTPPYREPAPGRMATDLFRQPLHLPAPGKLLLPQKPGRPKGAAAGRDILAVTFFAGTCHGNCTICPAIHSLLCILQTKCL